MITAFRQTTHKVRSGEHLNMIAEKYGTTSKVLQKYNGIQNANLLKVGQTIKIPAKGSTVDNIKTPPRPASHTVSKGDTFFAIANKYGLNPEELIKANSKINPNKIYIGQKLAIPGGTAQPSAAPKTNNAKTAAAPVSNNSEKAPTSAPKKSPYTKVVITKQISLGDFAKNYKMSVNQVNDVNGWSYDPETVFDVGSEAYVYRP